MSGVPLKKDIYILKILSITGTFAYTTNAIINASVTPISIASIDSLIVTVLYLSIIGTSFNTNSKSKFKVITYSTGFVVSTSNHFFDNSSSVPSSLISSIAFDTS